MQWQEHIKHGLEIIAFCCYLHISTFAQLQLYENSGKNFTLKMTLFNDALVITTLNAPYKMQRIRHRALNWFGNSTRTVNTPCSQSETSIYLAEKHSLLASKSLSEIEAVHANDVVLHA